MSDDQLTKLSKKIDQGFTKTNQKLSEHDKTFERFFTYMEKRFDQVDKRFDEVNSKVDDTYKILDAHLKKIEAILQENAARDQQFERMERWIHQIAEKTGTKLSYD